MANWKQELQQEIVGIDDVNRNDAVLTFRIDTLEDFFGGPGRIITLTRDLVVKAPKPVDVRRVDGMNYLAGDFVCQVAFLRLKAAHQPLPGDPEISINSVVKTLDEVRPFTAAGNWGIDLGDDKLAIGGDTWSIAAVKGDKWLDNEPALIEFTLRK